MPAATMVITRQTQVNYRPFLKILTRAEREHGRLAAGRDQPPGTMAANTAVSPSFNSDIAAEHVRNDLHNLCFRHDSSRQYIEVIGREHHCIVSPRHEYSEAVPELQHHPGNRIILKCCRQSKTMPIVKRFIALSPCGMATLLAPAGAP